MIRKTKTADFSIQNERRSSMSGFHQDIMIPKNRFYNTPPKEESHHQTKSLQFPNFNSNNQNSQYFVNLNPNKQNSDGSFNFDSKRQDFVNSTENFEPHFVVNMEKQDIFKSCSDSMIRFKKMEHVRNNRALLINELVEICDKADQGWKTFWTTIQILDTMIMQKGKITEKNIRLYGASAFFLSSKYLKSSNNKFLLDVVCSFFEFNREDIFKCEEEIFNWFCVVRNDLGFHFPTILDQTIECSPGAVEKGIKLIMIEAFYCVQDPFMIFDENFGDMTVKQLVTKIRQSLMEGKRFRRCQEIELFYFTQNGCNNIRKLGLKLRI